MNRRREAPARESAERARGGREEAAADSERGTIFKKQRRNDSRVSRSEGLSRRGGEGTAAAAPLRLPRRQLRPERGALTSAAER